MVSYFRFRLRFGCNGRSEDVAIDSTSAYLTMRTPRIYNRSAKDIKPGQDNCRIGI